MGYTDLTFSHFDNIIIMLFSLVASAQNPCFLSLNLLRALKGIQKLES